MSRFYFFFFFCFLLLVEAQGQGKLQATQIKPQSGIVNSYTYKPPKHLHLPSKVYVSLVYYTGNKYYYKFIPLLKKEENYIFDLKVPDSTSVVIFIITDEKNNTLDDNNKLGFVSYLYDNGTINWPLAYIKATYLLSYFAPKMLDLDKDKLMDKMIGLDRKAYTLSPGLKMKDELAYYYYLTLLYQKNADSAKPQLIAYANDMANVKADEDKWMYAIKMYRLLKMDERQKEIEYKATRIYPDGKLAKEIFLKKYFNRADSSENEILGTMHEFSSRFKDTSAQMKYTFYSTMIEFLIGNGLWSRLPVYEPLLSNKLALARLYYGASSWLCGKDLNKPCKNGDTAKLLARESLNIIADTLQKLSTDDNGKDLRNTYDSYADNYASILFKQGQYDSAFYYQDIIYARNSLLDPERMERYAVYAEKVKGINYARQVIEKKLLLGISSQGILSQLESIYKKLDLPHNEFEQLQKKGINISKQRIEEAIKLRFGNTTASNFTLKNISSQNISLSSLKNQTVVIDFWATWCGPCLASFPEMQELINKYKKDTNVVFLFISSWETKNTNEIHTFVNKLLKDKGYTFNILFDSNNKVARQYKVEYLPSKFIINKKGEIVYTGNDMKELRLILDEEIGF